MKLAAIFNVFDGTELLRASIDTVKDHVDKVIVVWQKKSNFGEVYNPFEHFNSDGLEHILEYVFFDPATQNGGKNERIKRNMGIQHARDMGCTHFISMDCDEFFEDFGAVKKAYLQSGADGSVCKMYTYFKKPTWRCANLDSYFVPLIHKLNQDTVSGVREYPFYVDPTRRINQEHIVELDAVMHHMSWVRLDIGLKCRNSSAKLNIEEGTLLADYNNPDVGPGFCVRDWKQELVEVPDIFNLSPIFDRRDPL
jgi:hypothetical protein